MKFAFLILKFSLSPRFLEESKRLFNVEDSKSYISSIETQTICLQKPKKP